MNTLEERAKKYAISVCDYKPQNGVAWDIATKDGYIQGATDQRKIDVKEILDAVDACFNFEWDTLNYNNWRDQVIDAMKKSVEELKTMEE